MTDHLTRPVPLWDGLPDYVQRAFSSVGVIKSNFDNLGPEYRLSLLDLFVKLRGTKISGKLGWEYIGNVTRTDVGIVEFNARDVNTLKEALKADPHFADPWWSHSWDSRELTLYYSVHFTHKQHWEKMVSVHIDPFGLVAAPGAIKKVEAVVHLPHHLYCYHDYKRVEDIRGWLLNNGWDRKALLGVGA